MRKLFVCMFALLCLTTSMTAQTTKDISVGVNEVRAE